MNYLASPFSHPDYWERAVRASIVMTVNDKLTALGHVVFSPIAVSAAYVARGVRRWNDPWWYNWSMDFLYAADEVWVLMIDGWRESGGVQAEIAKAIELGKPVSYVDPKTLDIRSEP